NQPKSPLNMNYLLAALSSPKETFSSSERIHFRRTLSCGAVPARLKRGNMKQRGAPSSAFCFSSESCTAVVTAILPSTHYSLTASLMPRMIVAPSILAADFSRLSDEIHRIETAGADWIHCDIMDGHFVDNISFGPDIVRLVRKETNLPLDVHLMI